MVFKTFTTAFNERPWRGTKSLSTTGLERKIRWARKGEFLDEMNPLVHWWSQF